VSGTRRTIARRAEVSGVGLHLGKPCRLAFVPAASGAGIGFVRSDRPGSARMAADAAHAVLSERRTQIGAGDEAIDTVEHVLAAVAGLGIDDVTVELDAGEPPIADGSAAPFVAALEAAGIVEQAGTVEVLTLRHTVKFVDGESRYEAHPADALSVEVTIAFPHPLIGTQSGRFAVTPATFAAELAPARTFGFVHEVVALRARGLIQGASVENAVVLDDTQVVSGPLRWPDEFLRHKALDVVGDLALAGRRVQARIVAHRPSHKGTVQLVRALLQHARQESRMLDADEIMKVLPHRYPFLLVDRILEMEANTRIVGLKNCTINEPFFQGHFPGHPIMPGVLIVEAMAQVGGMLLMGSVENPEDKVVYFMSLDNVKFRRPVKPGDQIRFELEMVQVRGKVCRMKGVAKVDGDVVAEAEMAAMVRDK
jgi:UDP-3-O-[3-hydroxymyristoyl] N-acetylglucosamine deacetylase/3-hydroxyacyl-[acyl-carrier-protein] dehydratase